MTDKQFEQLMDKLDEIAASLEVRQREWVRDTVIPPYQFEVDTSDAGHIITEVHNAIT